MKTGELVSDRGGVENGPETLRPHSAPRGLLHFYALMSIARKPMRGYDLMKEIEVKTEGAWRPGPGAVYPVLQKLVRQGYVSVSKKSRGGPARILYEITPAGLDRVTEAKKTMRTSTERMSMMSSLFLDLMESDDLVKFFLSSFDFLTQLVQMIVESDKSRLSDHDKLFVLRQYKLNLEREFGRVSAWLRELEAGTGDVPAIAGSGAKRGRK